MVDEKFERFKREFPALPVCSKCGAIKVKIRGEYSWRRPGDEDIYRTYKGYKEMYGSHIEPIKPGLCRRCNPETERREWDRTERREWDRTERRQGEDRK